MEIINNNRYRRDAIYIEGISNNSFTATIRESAIISVDNSGCILRRIISNEGVVYYKQNENTITNIFDISGTIIYDTTGNFIYKNTYNEDGSHVFMPDIDVSGNITLAIYEGIVTEYIYVYGSRVNDFHLINNDCILALVSSATCEVDKQLQATKLLVTIQQEQLNSKQASIDKLELDIANIMNILNAHNMLE
jgi:hypothetical protein